METVIVVLSLLFALISEYRPVATPVTGMGIVLVLYLLIKTLYEAVKRRPLSLSLGWCMFLCLSGLGYMLVLDTPFIRDGILQLRSLALTMFIVMGILAILIKVLHRRKGDAESRTTM